MKSPLPWEVLERIIDLSGEDSNTLRDFSLTCRQLHPRSRCVLFTRLDFKSRERISAFVDFLQDNPHLKPIVRSIVIQPSDFAPFPLLYILQNLSEIRFASRACLIATIPTQWHHSSLTCSQRFGSNVQSLHLGCLSFVTYLPFARVLLAFTNILHVTCTHVVINTPGNQASLGVIRRCLSEQMWLKTLTVSVFRCPIVSTIVEAQPKWIPCTQIDHLSMTREDRGASVDGFLFDPALAPSTVESLRLVRGTFGGPFGCTDLWRSQCLSQNTGQISSHTTLTGPGHDHRCCSFPVTCRRSS